MAVVAMKKIQVVTLKPLKDKVVSLLQKYGVCEFDNSNIDNNDFLHDLRISEKKIADLDFVLNFLSSYANNKKSFKYALMGSKEIYSYQQVEDIAVSCDVDQVILDVQDLEIQKNYLTKKISDLEKEIAGSSDFKSLDFNFSDLQEQSSIEVFLGKMKNQDFINLEKDLKEKTEQFDFIKANESETSCSFCLIMSKNESSVIKEIIRKYEITEQSFSKDCNNIKQYLQIKNQELTEIKLKFQKNNEKIINLAKDLPKLKACYDYYLWNLEQKKAIQTGFVTDYTVILSGWIVKDQFNSVKHEIEQLSHNQATVLELETETSDNIPVEIKNNKIFKPFEAVTRIFGLPKSTEPDPTPFLSLFFLVFFGFCLTDAIYGALLAAGAFCALSFMKVPRDMKGLFLLIGCAGISTVFMGMLFGGYAGISESVIPQFLLNFKQFDMNNGIMQVMAFAFGLGVIQLWFGTIVAGMHEWKNRCKINAFFSHYSWTIFFAIIGFSFLNILPADTVRLIAVFFMFFALSWNDPWYLKPIKGPLAFVNEIISWVSNVLSYARLFALGLSTGVIALVFNQIAITVGDMLPVGINFLAIFVILAFGHILNIGMNSLGAFIHSARLQFVEFFAKFMEGGGRRFMPLCRRSVHVYIDNED